MVAIESSVTAPAGSETAEVSVFRGRDGLAVLRDKWNSLTGGMSGKAFFHQCAWYESYLDSLEESPDSVHFFLVERRGLPAAIFVLKLVETMAGLGPRVLQFPAHPHMSLGDAIFDRSARNADMMQVLVSHLMRDKSLGWDVILIPAVLENSGAAFSLEAGMPRPAIKKLLRHSNYLPCGGSYDGATAQLAGSFRRNLRRLSRRAEQEGTVRYKSVREPDELRPAFEAFLEVEGSGWKGNEGCRTAIRCEPRLVAFYEQLMRRFSESRSCVINLLMLDETCMAAQFCMFEDRVLYVLKIGYRESLSHLAPGNLLFDHVLRDWGTREAVDAVSFVTDTSWQEIWRPQKSAVFSYRLFNHSWRGYLAFTWEAGKAVALRVGKRLGLLSSQKYRRPSDVQRRIEPDEDCA